MAIPIYRPAPTREDLVRANLEYLKCLKKEHDEIDSKNAAFHNRYFEMGGGGWIPPYRTVKYIDPRGYKIDEIFNTCKLFQQPKCTATFTFCIYDFVRTIRSRIHDSVTSSYVRYLNDRLSAAQRLLQATEINITAKSMREYAEEKLLTDERNRWAKIGVIDPSRASYNKLKSFAKKGGNRRNLPSDSFNLIYSGNPSVGIDLEEIAEQAERHNELVDIQYVGSGSTIDFFNSSFRDEKLEWARQNGMFAQMED